MAKKPKYKLEYLYSRYKKKVKELNLEEAEKYNELAQKLYNKNLDDRFNAKLARQEKNAGMFGFGRIKKIKYG
jgi:hypothetical protein